MIIRIVCLTPGHYISNKHEDRGGGEGDYGKNEGVVDIFSEEKAVVVAES